LSLNARADQRNLNEIGCRPGRGLGKERLQMRGCNTDGGGLGSRLKEGPAVQVVDGVSLSAARNSARRLQFAL
jgi:hypothetical protein